MPITLNDTRSLPDVLSMHRYELRFGLIPGQGIDQSLTIKCQQVTLPQSGNEAFEVKLNGHTNKHRGALKHEHTFDATFVETAGSYTLRSLQRWREIVVGTNSGNSGGYKRQYAIETVHIEVFDTAGLSANLHSVHGVFIENINAPQLDSTSSQPFLVTATFSFDYMHSNLKPLL